VQDFAVKSTDNLYTFLYIFPARGHDPEAADMNQNQSKSTFRQDKQDTMRADITAKKVSKQFETADKRR
jgi:hypothetical protein